MLQICLVCDKNRLNLYWILTLEYLIQTKVIWSKKSIVHKLHSKEDFVEKDQKNRFYWSSRFESIFLFHVMITISCKITILLNFHQKRSKIDAVIGKWKIATTEMLKIYTNYLHTYIIRFFDLLNIFYQTTRFLLQNRYTLVDIVVAKTITIGFYVLRKKCLKSKCAVCNNTVEFLAGNKACRAANIRSLPVKAYLWKLTLVTA